MRKYRRDNFLSREELALEIGISSRQLANIEQCNAICKIEVLAKILKRTGINFNSLI